MSNNDQSSGNSSSWRDLSPGIIAEYLSESEFSGILRKRFAIPPNHMGILIRDGLIVDAFEGGHFEVGGIWETLKSLLGGKHAFRFLLVDTKPFQHERLLLATTKDHQQVVGHLVLDLQIDPRVPANVLGLMENQSSLTADRVYSRLKTHLETRVLERDLHGHDAGELRGNTGLQDRLQGELSREVERLVGDLGLMLRSATLQWARTEEEERAMRRRRVELEEEDARFDYEISKKAFERHLEFSTFKIEAEIDAGIARSEAEIELALLLENNKLAISDARHSGQRAEELRDLAHQIELARQRRMDARQAQLDDATTDVQRRRLELEMHGLEAEFEVERRRQDLDIRRLEEQHARDRQIGDLDVATRGWELQRLKLEGMQSIELARDRERHTLDSERERQIHEAQLARLKQEQSAEIEKMKLQGAMSPDQLLAIQAGLSPDVARIFAERARADGASAAEKESVLRELADMTRRVGDDTADRIQSVVDAAFAMRAGHSAGQPKNSGAHADSKEDSSLRVRCAQCQHSVTVHDRFCSVCGKQLRG